jgi:phosphatidate phosphatase APP1
MQALMFLRIAQLDAKTLQHVVDRIESHSRTADSVYTTTSREQAEASVTGGSGNGPEESGEAVKTVRIEEPKRESRFDVRDMGYCRALYRLHFPITTATVVYYGV